MSSVHYDSRDKIGNEQLSILCFHSLILNNVGFEMERKSVEKRRNPYSPRRMTMLAICRPDSETVKLN